MKVIIIEDESRAAKDLKKMLEKIGADISILTILPSVETAIEWLTDNDAPDLIFSDIQLGDGLSFDIFKTIKISVPVIFCTAYDEYAIRAFESNSIDYLLKPISEDMLEQSLEKFDGVKKHFQSSLQQYRQRLDNVITYVHRNYPKTILVHFRDEIIPVKTTEVCYVYSSNGIITLHTTQLTYYKVPQSMEYFEQVLDPNLFFRANRQFLINRETILKVEHYFNRRLFIKLKCTTFDKIIISKDRVQEFLTWMES